MAKPTLYVFAISHYCEKARWALDRSGINYKLKFVAPAAHMQLAKKLGLKSTSVPILVTPDGVIQGSSEVVDWVDENATADKNLTPPHIEKECREVEDRLDEIIGIHLRRYYYSEAIVDHPETVKPILTQGVPISQKLLVSSLWSKIRGLMIKGMDLGPEQRVHSRDIVVNELDWLDSLLADGRSYLCGDSFSRADLAAASLISPVISPPEHPTYADFALPPILASESAAWDDRPVIAWTRKMYSDHR